MKKNLLFVIMALTAFFSTNAQQAGSIDITFNAGGNSTDTTVLSIAQQSDGKILIGGHFTNYNGTTANYLARLNTNGTLDNTFNTGGSGAANRVEAILVQPDGKILISGGFQSYNGTNANYMARLNTDGTLDNTFNTGGSGANFNVTTMALQPDGKIIIGGDFGQYNGITANHIARINADGTLDNTFNVGGIGANYGVYNMALQTDGKIVITGGFSDYNGTAVTNIARLNDDGTLDNTFNTGGSGLNIGASTIAIQTNGKILIGGYISTYNTVPINYITRLNTDGTLDNTFNVGGTGADNGVFKLLLQPNGKIVISGNFTTYNGTTINSIALLNTDGTLDNTFNSGSGTVNGPIIAMAQQSDGKIVIGGYFTSYNGTNAGHIARLYSDVCYVNIPDPNFKAYLLGNTGINTNNNSEIECSEAAAYNNAINCGNQNIADLTGIEAFTSITILNCNNNPLGSINISNNTALTHVNCGATQLTGLYVSNNTALEVLLCGNNQQLGSIDVSQNTALTGLNCAYTNISTLDVSTNTALTSLSCFGNLLTHLDISANHLLTSLYCSGNQLTILNIANGNNPNFTFLDASNNPNLTCIQVDDATYSTTNWTNPADFNIPTGASYSENCAITTSISKVKDVAFDIYPNPAKNVLNVTFKGTMNVRIMNLLGANVLSTTLTQQNTTIDVSTFPSGVYFLQTEKGIVKRFVKE